MRGWRGNGAHRAVYAIVLAAALGPAAGGAEDRVALVVGNGGYDRQHIPPLSNPVNDARLMAGALEGAGFQVRLVTDADIATMRAEIEGFGKELRRAGDDAVGLFYYAGHGVESRGTNYLIPVGAEIESAVEFEIDAVPARWVLSFMEAAGNRLNLVILDACRNNPFGTGRGAPQGLASMDAPSGSLIAYSAAPGQTATDGTGDNSPYTAALATKLAEPGLRLEDVFKRVRVEVEAATRGEQTPWENSSLRGDFYFVAPAVQTPAQTPTTVAAVTPPPPSPAPQREAGQAAYEAAERTGTVAAFRLVVERFPGTFYAALAKEQIAKLENAAPAAEAAEGLLGLKRDERRRIQAALSASGFQLGSPDGLFGPRTRDAIARWQSEEGVEATGYLDAAAARTLLAAAPPLLSPEEVEASLGLRREERRRIQFGLRDEGFGPGPPDGTFGPTTRVAIRAWQRKSGQTATGFLSRDQADAMLGQTPPAALLQPKCAELPGQYLGENHAECWVEIANRPECYLWHVHYHSDQVTGWSGECREGVADGHGAFSVSAGSEHTAYEGTGKMVGGKANGHWVSEWVNSSRYEGDFVDGKPHGYGVLTFSDGKVYDGAWTRGCLGEKDGRWAASHTTAEACGFR